MARPPPIRILSILVGALIGSILSYIYETTLWMYGIIFDYTIVGWIGITPSDMAGIFMWPWWSMMVFVTIPALAGFIAGLIDPQMAMQNGLFIGLLSGVVNSIMATVRLVYSAIPHIDILYGFSFFAFMSIFLWMLIASAAGLLAKRY